MSIKIPRILRADSYTVGSGPHVSQDAKDYSAYQISFRQRPKWMDEMEVESRFLFHGFQGILREVVAERIAQWELDESTKFLSTYHADGGNFAWDKTIWERTIKEHNGMLPIRVWALPDGAACFLGEPVIQIEAENGFGELAGYFESDFVKVWAASERATLDRHWLEYNKSLVKRCTTNYLDEKSLYTQAGLMRHDFGDRAGACSMESQVLGLAQLTSHFSTDTTAAAYLAWKLSGEKRVASTIHALAHRIVQGYKLEGDAYLALFNLETKKPTSHVGDCYNWYVAVTRYLVPLAKQAKETGGIIIGRPDSGDRLDGLKYLFDTAKDNDLALKNPHNGLYHMTSLRGIAGDSISFKIQRDLDDALLDMKYSPPHCLGYGVGGYARNVLARDNFGTAMKLCAVGKEKRPVMKFSHTPGKGSIPGLVKICRERDKPTVRALSEPGENQMVLWYDGISGAGFTYEEDFQSVRNRVLEKFKEFPVPTDVVSPAIKELKNALYVQYVR